VVGYDASHDIAVLQLTGASGLTTAATGNSSTVRVGDKVVGIGNAGGVGGTPSVAAGTVTALNQSITASDEGSSSSEQLSGLIETNADIQAGDSGGPLVNSHGQVVGVDTAASSAPGGSSDPFGGSGDPFGGSGDNGSSNSGQQTTTQAFAIPINTALSIANQIESGHASATVHIGTTAFLGVEIAPTGQQDNSGSFGSSGSSGVAIAGVQSGTPAAAAGLSQGDVITSVAGQSVNSGTDIQQVLASHHPGDKISISWTDAYGQSHTATVTLAAGPAA
jgi:S1-C subfamily serine protease